MFKRVFLLVVVVLLSVGVMQAQTVTGTIVGTVVDSTGAAIPNAQITILNQDTGISRTATSTDEGQFRVPQLSSGVYTVSAEAPGLSKTEIRGVQVAVAGESRVDVKMSVASTTTEVQVSADALAVNTQTASVSTLMTQSSIEEVPLNARDVQQLAIIQPGVQSDPNNNWGAQIVIAGSRPQQNRYLQEGVDTTWTSKTAPVSAAGVVLGVEAVKEFQVLASNYTAEYGERAGGTLNTIFKSGSNAWHGSGYEYLRNSWFDARSVFDRQALLNKPPAFKRHQFGAAVAGPIIKDKHFFFVNYEGFRHILGVSRTATVPDANARLGILPCRALATASLTAAQGTGDCPASADPSFQTSYTLTPLKAFGTTPAFIGPSSFIINALNLMVPKCTAAPTSPIDGTCPSVSSASERVGENFVVSKLDFTLTDKDNLTTSYNYDASLSNSPQSNPNFNLRQKVRKQIFTARETHIFSPNFLNTLNFGVNRTSFLWSLGAGIPIPTTIPGNIVAGGPSVSSSPYTIPAEGVMSPDGQHILPVVSITGLTSIGAFASGTTVTPRWVGYTGASITDDVDILHGRHALKFGVQVKRWHDNVYNSASQYMGTIAFQGLEKLLRSQANTFGQVLPGSDIGRGWRSWLFGVYAEDTYKLMSNLTLIAGLRWEMVPGPGESLNRMTNLYDPYNQAIPNASVTDKSTTLYHASPRNFEPRIGIAWDPFKNGKTSVRTGFGIFHDEIEPYYYFIAQGHDAPYSTRISLKSTDVCTPSCTPRWPPIPIADLQTIRPTLSTTLQAFGNIMPQYPKSPVKYSYNFEVQQQMPWKLILSAGYVGSFGRQLGRSITYTDYRPISQAPGTTTGCGALGFASVPTCGCPATAISNCLFWPGSGLTATECTAVITTNCSARVNPNWASTSGTVFDSNSFYNSIEIRLQRQATNGVSVRMGFTHVSCYTDSSGETPGAVLNGSTAATYGDNASSSRGRCAFTASDRGTLTLGYDVPFFKSSDSTLLKTLFAGWNISTLTDVARGYPMNVASGVNVERSNQGGGAGPDRPSLKPGCTLQNAIRPGNFGTLDPYIKGECLTPGQFGYMGTLEANAFTGPSFFSTDASLKKDFALHGERVNLRLQFDMFNVFNRTNLGTTTNSTGVWSSSTVGNGSYVAGTANTAVANGQFGRITSIIGTPRQLQLGARISF